jgi:hypothetical protein
MGIALSKAIAHEQPERRNGASRRLNDRDLDMPNGLAAEFAKAES